MMIRMYVHIYICTSVHVCIVWSSRGQRSTPGAAQLSGAIIGIVSYTIIIITIIIVPIIIIIIHHRP